MQSSLTSKNITWTDLSAPTPEELAALVRAVPLTPLDAEFIVHNYHRPEVTVRDEYILLLIHVPVFNKQTRVTAGHSLYFLIYGEQLWTLHFDRIVALDQVQQDFANSPEKQEEYFQDTALGLALHLVEVMYGSAFKKLERLHKHINIAEDAVFKGNERKMVEEISILVRDVMDFRKVIRPQQRLFTTTPSHPSFAALQQTQWQRLNGQINKLWEVLESLSEGVVQLSNTNQTLLQHKQNQLLRLLTYYSISSLPIYAMMENLHPRGTEATLTEATIYWGLMVLLLAIPLGIFLHFRRKRVF